MESTILLVDDVRLFLETASRFVREVERREVRKPVNLSGMVQSRGTTFPCALHNMSAGGAFLSADFQGEARSEERRVGKEC